MEDLGTKSMIKELAAEELMHKDIINKAIDEGQIENIKLGEKCYILDLGIANIVTPEVVDKDMTVGTVLRIAMKYSENMRLFYENMANRFKGNEVEKIFRQCEHEEMCHRNNIQLLYDDLILSEN